MEIREATEADSPQLKEFFERMHLPGAIDLSIRREGSFFNQYRLLSNDFQTLKMIDDTGELAGLASLVFRNGLVAGENQTWGYATDLRIAPTRKAILQWAQLFLPAIEKAIEEHRCKYILSAVEHHDNQAYNALIHPTSHSRRRLPRYHLVNRFRVVNLHGRSPLADKPLKSIKLKVLTESDVEPLCAYLGERAQKRTLARVHTPETFMEKLGRWPGMQLSDFRMAMDKAGKILGCAALWNGRRVQSFTPVRYHGFAATAQQTLKLASYLGFVRAPSAPGQVMPTQFLTHLSTDSPEAFHTLVDDAFRRLGPREFLSYVHFRGNWRTLPPRGYIATSLPFGLYLILPPNAEPPVWPRATLQTLPPEFDIAWL